MLVWRFAVKRTEPADRGTHGGMALPKRSLRPCCSRRSAPRFRTAAWAADAQWNLMKTDGRQAAVPLGEPREKALAQCGIFVVRCLASRGGRPPSRPFGSRLSGSGHEEGDYPRGLER